KADLVDDSLGAPAVVRLTWRADPQPPGRRAVIPRPGRRIEFSFALEFSIDVDERLALPTVDAGSHMIEGPRGEALRPREHAEGGGRIFGLAEPLEKAEPSAVCVVDSTVIAGPEDDAVRAIVLFVRARRLILRLEPGHDRIAAF